MPFVNAVLTRSTSLTYYFLHEIMKGTKVLTIYTRHVRAKKVQSYVALSREQQKIGK